MEYATRNARNEVIGGIIADLGYWGGIELNILWLHEDYLNSGIVTASLRKIEAEGREKGAIIPMTNAFDFQARDFM